MEKAKYCFKKLDESAISIIKELFVSVFSNEPWNDDWSDENQLHLYIQDLIGQSNSLTFGLFEGTELIGISMGHIKHWYTGTEYLINELCIDNTKQGQGIGTMFLNMIERNCKELGLTHIFLLTENDVPAFEFYKKNGFCELENSVSFAKEL
ncbi:MAG: GNAT family N-acetyltransferase [Oscillospiraceae bacterium]|nr:GNAT family N-acetyltransferase [Oscillospiraceae bacterium]